MATVLLAASGSGAQAPEVSLYEAKYKEVEQMVNWILESGDPRVRNWPLMNPFHVLAAIFAYFLVIYCLVRCMRRRDEPFGLKNVVILHNLGLAGLSAYMFGTIALEAYERGYKFYGNAVDTTPAGDRMAGLVWIFYVSKVWEFGDTVIMALKQNFRQISFLHLYHHSSIFLIWWIVIFYGPGGESYFSAALNSWIHVIMYSYYLWSIYVGKPPMGKNGKPYITWRHPSFYKQFITSMQMTQFLSMFVQAICCVMYNSPYPRFLCWILFYYMLTMLVLFGNFCVQNYIFGDSDKAKTPRDVTDKKDKKDK